MKNKNIYIIFAALVVGGFILFSNGNLFIKKEPVDNNDSITEHKDLNNEEPVESSDQTEEVLVETNNGQIKQLPVNQVPQPALPDGNIATDDFQITPPSGWEGRPAPNGILAIAVSTKEALNNQTALDMGFKSYFAVTKDNLRDQTREDYVIFIGDELKKAFSSVSLEKVWTTKIDERDSSILEVSLNQQGVDFKALIFLVWDGEDIWIISFNTITDKWSEYEDKFFLSGSSFKLK